jgi:hypothetical protein
MTMRASIILDLGGNFAAQARRNEAALGGLARSGQRDMGLLARSAQAAGRGLDSLGNRYTALLSGAAGVGAAKMVMDLERRFTRLGIQADVADSEMRDLKKSIYEVGQAPDIRVDPGEITSAIESIVEKTGDLKFAQENIRNIGLAIQATGAQGKDIGEVLAEFQKQGIMDPKQVMEALDVLNVQGKAGAFTLQNLAALGPRVITAYTAGGRSGVQAMREMGAALQLIRQGTGSSEMAATAFEATMRTLTDPAKLKLLGKAGITVFDPEKLKQGQRVLRPINEIMAEIIQKTKGDKVKLGTIFDAEAVRAFNAAASEFVRTGSLESLDKFMNVQADGTTTTKDSARAAKDAAGALTNLLTVWKSFADEQLSGPIQDAADALNALGPENTGRIIKGIAGVGVALGGLVLARKAWVGGKGLYDFFKGGAGKAAGGLAGGITGPIPVYVVNGPGAVGGGASAGAGAALTKSGSRAGKLAAASKWAGRLGGALAVAGTAAEIGSAWMGNGSTREKVATTTSGVGGLGGGWVGAKIGAAIGTAILPGVGTAIGGVLGGALGYYAGSKGGEALGKSLTSEDIADAVNAKEAHLRIEVTGPAAVRDIRTSGFTADVDSGLYMGAH